MSEWRPIIGYEGIYEVSNEGEVRSLDHETVVLTRYGEVTKRFKGKILSQGQTTKGYRQVFLYDCGKGRMCLVHRLVASAFLPNPFNLKEVNHKDGVKSNNAVENLEWVSAQENMKHRFNVLGHLGSHRKLSPYQVKAIRSSSQPQYELALKYGVSQRTISEIKLGHIYREVV